MWVTQAQQIESVLQAAKSTSSRGTCASPAHQTHKNGSAWRQIGPLPEGQDRPYVDVIFRVEENEVLCIKYADDILAPSFKDRDACRYYVFVKL